MAEKGKRTKPKNIAIIAEAILFLFLYSSHSFAAAPAVGTITPSSGTSNPNEAVSFTTTYSDLDTWLGMRLDKTRGIW